MKEIGASRVPEKIINHTRLKSRPPGQICRRVSGSSHVSINSGQSVVNRSQPRLDDIVIIVTKHRSFRDYKSK